MASGSASFHTSNQVPVAYPGNQETAAKEISSKQRVLAVKSASKVQQTSSSKSMIQNWIYAADGSADDSSLQHLQELTKSSTKQGSSYR